MRLIKLLITVLSVTVICTSCGEKKQQTKKSEDNTHVSSLRISGNDAYNEVRNFVSLGSRDSGTPGAKQAATYLASSLRELGIAPLTDEFTEESGRGKITFRNVIGVIDGNGDDSIIIASHYDTKSGISDKFVGANDSGSSTGLLLTLAGKLQKNGHWPFNIIIAFLDGEECIKRYCSTDGLHGSRHLAQTLVANQRKANIKAVIVLDMIGDKDLQISIPRNSTPELISLTFKAAKVAGYRKYFSLSDSMILDDHVPFLRKGMPAIDLIDFKYGSAPGKNDYWHTTADTMDKISAKSLEITGNVVLEMVNMLADIESGSHKSE